MSNLHSQLLNLFGFSIGSRKSVFFILNKSDFMHNIPFISGGINNLSRNSRSISRQYYTRNTCIQQPLALVSKLGTIFSEHEVFRDCCHFYTFDIFAKIMKIMKKLSVLITKYTICTNCFS